LTLSSEDSIKNTHAKIDLYDVVNCAGFDGEITNPMDTDLAIFDKVIAINVYSALLVIKYVA